MATLRQDRRVGQPQSRSFIRWAGPLRRGDEIPRMCDSRDGREGDGSSATVVSLTYAVQVVVHRLCTTRPPYGSAGVVPRQYGFDRTVRAHVPYRGRVVDGCCRLPPMGKIKGCGRVTRAWRASRGRTVTAATPQIRLFETQVFLEPPSEQAHLPAEQPPPCEDPRLPAAHADPCRARHRREPAQQGPRPPVGLKQPDHRSMTCCLPSTG